MKKAVGFFWVMMCVLTLSGCGRTAKAEDIQTEANEFYEEKTEKFGDAYNDLVYREYSLGCDLEEGCNIFIEKNKVVSEVDDVQCVVVLLDNGVYKEFDFDDGDIEFIAEKSGNYAFLAIDSEGNSVDIISIVKVYISADGGVMPLG